MMFRLVKEQQIAFKSLVLVGQVFFHDFKMNLRVLAIQFFCLEYL